MPHSLPFLTEAAIKRGACQLLTTLLLQLKPADSLSCTVPVTAVFPGDTCPDFNQLTQYIYALRGCGLSRVDTDESGGRISSYFPLFAVLGYDEHPYQIVAKFNPALLTELQEFGERFLIIHPDQKHMHTALEKLLPVLATNTSF